MSETTTVTRQQAETIRKDAISLLDHLNEKAGRFELPRPPEALEHYRKRLVENTHKVLVVGEAKRGKSTFVNALVGREILPTDVAVATSQVFNVRRAEREAYRLRFEDGSARDITLEDLERYGSQVAQDRGERPTLDRVIRWIEVDMPAIRFLPKGVSLLDTPGTGGLYARHALITNRFVPEADAVIFVLSSEQPMVHTEEQFLKNILDVTPDVFFIQTKIGLLGKERWQETLNRNQQILQDKFGDRLTDMRIWPMDSELLLEAPSPDEDREGFEEDFDDSRYEDVETALQEFLFRVAGWRRSALAVFEAGRYHSSARATLSTRLTALEQDEGKLKEMQRRAADRRQQFEADWGQRGRKRGEIVEGIRRTAAQGQRSMKEALQPLGRIAIAQRARIEVVTSLEEAEDLNEQMPGDLVAATQEEWRRLRELAEKRFQESLGPFLLEADALSAQEDAENPNLVVRGKDLQALGGRLWEPLRGAWREYSLAGIAAGTVLSITVAPLAIATAAIGLVGAFVYGWKSSKQRQLAAVQAQLSKNLDSVLHQVRTQFTETDMESGRFGLVEEYFTAVERAMMDQIQTIAKQKEQEAKAEYARLVETGKLNEQQRQESIGQTKRQLDEWDALGKTIEGVSARLNALDTPAVAPSPVTT